MAMDSIETVVKDGIGKWVEMVIRKREGKFIWETIELILEKCNHLRFRWIRNNSQVSSYKVQIVIQYCQ